jgi:hypothetical protein
MVMCGLWPEVGGSMFLINVRIGPKYYMAQQPVTLAYIPLSFTHAVWVPDVEHCHKTQRLFSPNAPHISIFVSCGIPIC